MNWSPPVRFSYGTGDKEWIIDFSLTELGARTLLRYTRRYRKKPWLEDIGDRVFWPEYVGSPAEYQKMTDAAVERIVQACTR